MTQATTPARTRRFTWAGSAAGTLAGCVVAVFLVGCSSTPKDEFSTQAVEKLYSEARDELSAGGWDRAIKILERVEGRAAGTLLAQQASLDIAYARYKSGERTEANAALDKFIRLNPSSPALDYAYYLKGLVNFNDNLGWLQSLAGQDVTERDQQASRDAFQAFRQLVTQFPQSRYSPDARVRMDYIANALADYEVHVARYYFRRGAYLASVNRAQQALAEFERAPASEEALAIMVRGYDRLGMNDLRDDAMRVLNRNFPNSRYLRDNNRGDGRAWWRFW